MFKHFKKYKYGFTLAEVLITLGIIGVVASMTMPALINNYRAKVLHTEFKKMYAELNQVAMTFYNDTGYTIHEYDWYVNTPNFKGSAPILEQFLSYYKSYRKEGHWRYYDSGHKIKNKEVGGQVSASRYCDATKVYSDQLGRLYVLDDSITSAGYGGRYNFGPKICVDTNGAKAPNRWGYDRFVFVFGEDSKVIPYTGKYPDGIHFNMTEKEDIKPYCDVNKANNGSHACAYFALNDINPTDFSKSYWKTFVH